MVYRFKEGTMQLDAADAFLRIGAAGGCGALIGLERETRNQLAGVRTHALVATGAAIFTLAGAHGFPNLHRGPNVDPMRVAAQIASGIGFIGAGAIIRDRGSVRGITTAAALWTSAAIGLATGAGLVFAKAHLDLTNDLIRRYNAGEGKEAGGAAPAPAGKAPAAPAKPAKK